MALHYHVIAMKLVLFIVVGMLPLVVVLTKLLRMTRR